MSAYTFIMSGAQYDNTLHGISCIWFSVGGMSSWSLKEEKCVYSFIMFHSSCFLEILVNKPLVPSTAVAIVNQKIHHSYDVHVQALVP